MLGGGLYMDDRAITYKTNKLTVDRKYRNLVLPKDEICQLTWQWIVFPIATFHTVSGEKYKFIIFNKRGFEKSFDSIR